MINGKKIIVVIPAYNNEQTIEKVFDRVPVELFSLIDEFIIVNDGSTDKTDSKIRFLKTQYPSVTSLTHKMNQGYARAQKTGFRAALNHGVDIAVLLHSDGQYAPEELATLLAPLLADECDIVQGGRILGGKALKGGMPLYKYIAIRVGSFFENLIYGMNLLEFHSGYMLYSRRALESIPFEKLSDTFYFDGEMLFVGHEKGLRIQSLPISTYYHKEIKSGVKPVKYILDVSRILIKKLFGRYRF